MKKRIRFLCLGCLWNTIFCLSAFGQGTTAWAVTSSGGVFKSNTLHLSWSLGETCIESFSRKDLFLSEGFHQEYSSPLIFTISGRIHEGNQLMQHGEVRIFKASSPDADPEVFGIPVQDGNFMFSFVPEDYYILGAFPENGNYLPTYHGDVTGRTEAYILHNTGFVSEIDIHLIPNVTSFDGLKQHDILIYPNPVENMLFFKISDNSEVIRDIDILNMQGEFLFNKKVRQGNKTHSIAADHLMSGFYILKISTRSESVYKAFIKR